MFARQSSFIPQPKISIVNLSIQERFIQIKSPSQYPLAAMRVWVTFIKKERERKEKKQGKMKEEIRPISLYNF
jgi:hypothetical protein